LQSLCRNQLCHLPFAFKPKFFVSAEQFGSARRLLSFATISKTPACYRQDSCSTSLLQTLTDIKTIQFLVKIYERLTKKKCVHSIVMLWTDFASDFSFVVSIRWALRLVIFSSISLLNAEFPFSSPASAFTLSPPGGAVPESDTSTASFGRDAGRSSNESENSLPPVFIYPALALELWSLLDRLSLHIYFEFRCTANEALRFECLKKTQIDLVMRIRSDLRKTKVNLCCAQSPKIISEKERYTPNSTTFRIKPEGLYLLTT